MATTGRAALSWRFRGRSVSPEAFLAERDKWHRYLGGSARSLVPAATSDIERVIREQLELDDDVAITGGTLLQDELRVDSLDVFELLSVLEEEVWS